MVWEQEASLIIMLTTTVERGRVSWVLFYLSRCDPRPPFTAPLFCHEQNRSQLKRPDFDGPLVTGSMNEFQYGQTRNSKHKISRNLVAALAQSSRNCVNLPY